MCVESQCWEAPESYGTYMGLKSEKEWCESQSRQMVGKSSFFRPARRAIQATKDSLHVGFSLPCGRSGSGGWRYSKWNDHHLCWAFRCDHGEPKYGIHGFLPLLITQANHFRCPRLVDPKQWDNQPERISTRMWRRSPDLVSFRYDNGDRITKAEVRYESHPKTLCFQEILM